VRFRSIQLLRAVAALLVVFFHLSDGRFVTGGFGVDVFFVISGFIMGTVGAQESAPAFALKRAARIIPLYWLCTLFMCVQSLFGVFARFTFDAESLAKSLFFIPYYDSTGHIWPLVVVGWTLNFEAFFYVLFTAGLLIGAPIVFSVATLSILVLAGQLIPFDSAPLQVWTSPLLLEFAAGLLLARSARPSGMPVGLSLVGLGIAILAVVSARELYDDSYRALVWGMPAALIVAGGLAIERAGAWSRLLYPLEAMGDASYSLYLWHGMPVTAGHKFLGHSVAANLLILVVAIALAFLSYHAFEKPVGRYLARRARCARRPAPALAAGVGREGPPAIG